MSSPQLLGRARDLEVIDQSLLAGSRLLTITGTAGVGKSALARAIAELWRERGEVDVVWADLSEAGSWDDACSTLAGRLGVALQGDVTEERIGELAHALSGMGVTLLVLDNFERLAADAPSVFPLLLERAPETQFLVSSRARLRVPAELAHELQPLGLPAPGEAAESSDAVRLWVERTRQRTPEYQLTPTDAVVVAQLVRELDGLPLAIELCAAKAPLLGPADQLRRLENRFELLRGSYPGGVPHHATLEAAIEWSWNLLEADEQAALAQCSVFRGGFTIEAAEAVISIPNPERSSAEILQSLAEKSLLTGRRLETLPGERRLSLSVSVREFAQRALQERGAVQAVEQRHAQHYVALGQRLLDQISVPDTTARLSLERENLLAVVQRALTDDGDMELCLAVLLILDRFAWRAGGLVPHAALLDRALELHKQKAPPSALRVQALHARGQLAPALARADAGEADYSEMAELARQLERPDFEGRALLALAECQRLRGAFEKALELAERAQKLAQSAGELELEIDVLGSMSAVARQQGRLVDSIAHCERALELARSHGRINAESRVLALLANIHVESATPELAKGYVSLAAKLAHESGDNVRGHVLNMLLGNLEHVADALPEAERIYAEVHQAARQSGDRRTEAYSGAYLAFAKFEQGEQSAAELMLRDAVALLQRSGERRYELFAKSALAVMVGARARFDMALALLEEAESGLRGDVLWSMATELSRGLIECEMARHASPEEARSLMEAARERLARAHASDSPLSPSPAARSAEVRRLCQLLERALSDPASALPDGQAQRLLVVDRQGRWFEPFPGNRVDLRRRAPMARMLVALAEAHQANAIPASDLITLGWPGERMLADAAQNRLYVTLSRLRDLGLRDALQSTRDGYTLDPGLSVRVV